MKCSNEGLESRLVGQDLELEYMDRPASRNMCGLMGQGNSVPGSMGGPRRCVPGSMGGPRRCVLASIGGPRTHWSLILVTGHQYWSPVTDTSYWSPILVTGHQYIHHWSLTSATDAHQHWSLIAVTGHQSLVTGTSVTDAHQHWSLKYW